MSASKPCAKCYYQWSQNYDDSPCNTCYTYDRVNEIYNGFENFQQAINADRLRNIWCLSIDELAMLLLEINDPTRERGGWLNWLKKEL